MSLVLMSSSMIRFYTLAFTDRITHFFPLFMRFWLTAMDMGAGSFLPTRMTSAPWSAKYMPQNTVGASPSNYSTLTPLSIIIKNELQWMRIIKSRVLHEDLGVDGDIVKR